MKKILIHIGIWLVLAYFLFISLAMFVSWWLAAERSLTGMLLMAGMFYVSGWVLANQFLIRRNKPGLFAVCAILFAVLFSILRTQILGLFPLNLNSFGNHFPDELFNQGGGSQWGRNLWLTNRLEAGRAPYLVGFLMNTVILIIAVLYRLYEHKAQKELEGREKLQRSQEAQILYLKSQVNPHFLFNTLNNLYGLTYSKSDQAPKMVLGLSDTMRYMIYETEQKLVPVEKELNFIRNYLDLEKMRISYPENIRISMQVKHTSVFIPPLLLLPFIENCFKHGTIGKEEDGWLEMDIWDDNRNFYFVCKNSFRERIQKPGSSGIGLTNVRQRLELIFGENYELKTLEQSNEYMVSLQFPVFTKKDQL